MEKNQKTQIINKIYKENILSKNKTVIDYVIESRLNQFFIGNIS